MQDDLLSVAAGDIFQVYMARIGHNERSSSPIVTASYSHLTAAMSFPVVFRILFSTAILLAMILAWYLVKPKVEIKQDDIGAYVLTVGVYSDPVEAATITEQLRSNDIAVELEFVELVSGAQGYRIALPPIEGEVEKEAMEARLDDLGYRPRVRRIDKMY
jgi:hypothetical protein